MRTSLLRWRIKETNMYKHKHSSFFFLLLTTMHSTRFTASQLSLKRRRIVFFGLLCIHFLIIIVFFLSSENAHRLFCIVFGSRLFYGFCSTSTKNLMLFLKWMSFWEKIHGKYHCSIIVCLFE